MRIGIFLGGISAERNISLESGRNVFLKLHGSGIYEDVIPIFVTGTLSDIHLFIIPMKLLFHDNVDDIIYAINHYKKYDYQDSKLNDIIKKYSDIKTNIPLPVSFEVLPNIIDFAFIALHGRPGEDGSMQRIFEKIHLPYNGSNPDVAEITMNKYLTNQKLKINGFLVADQYIINMNDWNDNKYKILHDINTKFQYNLIIKPVDDGSSMGVIMIHNEKELTDYIDIAFRNIRLTDDHRKIFNLKSKSVIPFHQQLLVESLISKRNADKFLEISCGMVTNNHGQMEIFSSSETISQNTILSAEEKFLSGEGCNITPARFSHDNEVSKKIDDLIKEHMYKLAKVMNIYGYARVDAFVKIFGERVELWIIEINSLPALTPATCIFHQAALNGYKPIDLINMIINSGCKRVSS